MKRIQYLFNQFLAIGFRPELSFIEIQKTFFFNLFTLVALPVVPPFLLINLIHARYGLAILNIFQIVIYVLAIFINYYRKHIYLRSVIILFSSIIYIIGAFFYRNGNEYLLIVNLIAAVIFFDKKWHYFLFAIFSVAVFSYIKIEQNHFSSLNSVVINRATLNMIVGLSIFVIVLQTFKLLYTTYQINIETALVETKKLENDLKEKLRIIEVAQKIANVGYFIGFITPDSQSKNLLFSKWDCSETLLSILGIDRTFQGNDFENWLTLIIPAYRNEAIRAYENALKNKGGVNLKVQVKRPNDNSIRWIRFYGDMEFDENRKPLFFILYLQDVTELSRLAFDRQIILDSISDNFYVLDKTGNLLFYNKHFGRNYLLVDEDEAIGKNIFDFFPLLKESIYGQKLKEAFESNQAQHYEFFFESNDRFSSWYEQYFYPFENGCSVLFRDISERKKTEENLIQLNRSLNIKTDELINTNAELERFAYVASHDLQEPLRMVTSFMQLIQNKYSDIIDETGKKYIHFAVDGADRMKVLIQDLLQYSRVGSGSLQIHPVDMNHIMKEVLLLFKNEIYEIDADIIVEPLPVIHADKSAMLQLMQNLIGNALKYRSAEKPTVIISAAETEFEWLISVKDNGIGIDEAYSEKIFVIFQRLHTKDVYSGTGIGLAICKKIIERYAGKIWVESTLNKGAVFKFTIPKK